MSRRRTKRRPELTALIDVLFILLFAALVQARGSAEREVERARTARDVRESDAGPDAGADAAVDAGADAAVDAGMDDAGADAAPGDAGAPREPEHLRRAREAASLLAQTATDQRFYVVEVSADGRLTAIVAWTAEGGGPRTPLDRRLQLAGSGDRTGADGGDGGREEPERICAIVAEHLAATEIERAVFLIVPAAGTDYKLWTALRNEVERCQDETRWLAILIDPGMIPAFGTNETNETTRDK